MQTIQFNHIKCKSITVTHTILRFTELKFYCKFKNSELPYYLQNLPFNTNADTHTYNTRKHYDIQQLRPNHEYARKCL